MPNIILEGLDFTGKTPLTTKLSGIFNLDLIDKDKLNKIIENPYDIEKNKLNLAQLNNLDNSVFDRHFLSLLVYWKLTNKDFYDKNIDEEKVFFDFLKLNEGSLLSFRYGAFDDIRLNILNRIDYREDRLSKHDLDLLNKTYFHDYSFAFHDIFNNFNEYNKKKGRKVFTDKHNISKISFNKSLGRIIYSSESDLSLKQSDNQCKINNNVNQYIPVVKKEISLTLESRETLERVYSKCVKHIENSSFSLFTKSKFVSLNLDFSLNFYKQDLIVNYWEQIYDGLISYIKSNFSNNENKVSRFIKALEPLTMSGIDFQKYQKKNNKKTNKTVKNFAKKSRVKTRSFNQKNTFKTTILQTLDNNCTTIFNSNEKPKLEDFDKGELLSFENTNNTGNLDVIELRSLFASGKYNEAKDFYYSQKRKKPELHEVAIWYLNDLDFRDIYDKLHTNIKAFKYEGLLINFLDRLLTLKDNTRSLALINIIEKKIDLFSDDYKKIFFDLKQKYEKLNKQGELINIRYIERNDKLKQLFLDGKYQEAHSYYKSFNNRTDVSTFIIFIENISDKDFCFEYAIKRFNVHHQKNYKALNLILSRLLVLVGKSDEMKVDIEKAILYVGENILNKGYEIKESLLEKYNKILSKKEEFDKRVLKFDYTNTERISLRFNINFNEKDRDYIDSICNDLYLDVDNKKIRLGNISQILKYLLENNYSKGLDFFKRLAKNNTRIFLFLLYARQEDIMNFKEDILKYFKKENSTIGVSGNPKSDNMYNVVRQDYLYDKLLDTLDNNSITNGFLIEVESALTKKGFKNLTKRKYIKEEVSVNNKEKIEIDLLKQAFENGDFDMVTKLLGD